MPSLSLLSSRFAFSSLAFTRSSIEMSFNWIENAGFLGAEAAGIGGEVEKPRMGE
jgi:hypothetical protein